MPDIAVAVAIVVAGFWISLSLDAIAKALRNVADAIRESA